MNVDDQTTVVSSGSVYPPGTGDLTLEAWVQTAGPGPLLSFGALAGTDQLFYEAIALGVSADGAVGFRLQHQASGTAGVGCQAFSGPTEIR